MEPIDLFISSNNKVASDALSIFIDESKLIEDLTIRRRLKEINNDAFSFLSGFLLEKLFISATTSNSVFYRFNISGSEYDFMMEIFMDFDGEGNIGATLQVYKNSSRFKSFSGTPDKIYNSILNITFDYEQEAAIEPELLENSDFTLLLPKYV